MSDQYTTKAYNLISASNLAIQIVAGTTKYLSTLPHTVEVIEEKVSLLSVISALLIALNSTVTRHHPDPEDKPAFIKPLCHDILLAFSHFHKSMKEAQNSKVFEPNSDGLVRLPKNAWAHIMGGESNMISFRNRLYVEKYRVRVLIDAVAWQGIKLTKQIKRTPQQEQELEIVRKMLPLIAERMVGVWRDYKPRIESGNVANVKAVVQPEAQKHPLTVAPVATEIREYDDLKKDTAKITVRDCGSTESLASAKSTCTCSSASTLTDTNDSILECWILRHHKPMRTVSRTTSLFGLSIQKSYTHTPGHYYIKSHPSTQLEAEQFISVQISTRFSPKKEVLKLPEDAQYEIQKLIEARENASSNDKTKRSFNLVAIQTQPRRKISPASTSWWNRRGRRAPIEWMLVLKGETIDHEHRSMPVKHADAWDPTADSSTHAPPVLLPREAYHAQQQQHYQIQLQQYERQQRAYQKNLQQYQLATSNVNIGVAKNNSQSAAPIYRRIEQRKTISVEEAEKKLEEMNDVLFKTCM